MRILLITALFVGVTAFGQNEKIGINTALPKTTLDVNGDMTVRKLEKLSGDIKPLYIDKDGLVGTMVSKEEKVSSAIFSASSKIIVLNLNEGKEVAFNERKEDIPIPCRTTHIDINTLGVAVRNSAFQIKEDGIYELNTFVNFYLSSSKDNRIFMIVTLQTSTDDGVTWTNITGSRPVFLQTVQGGMNHPHNLPTTIASLTKGTLVRIAFKRSYSGTTAQGATVNSMRVGGNANYATKSFELVIKKL